MFSFDTTKFNLIELHVIVCFGLQLDNIGYYIKRENINNPAGSIIEQPLDLWLLRLFLNQDLKIDVKLITFIDK